MLLDESKVKQEEWVKKYLSHSKHFVKLAKCVWKGKYTGVVRKEGVFGSEVFFPKSKVVLNIDNMELIPDKTIHEMYQCKHEGCLFSSSTPQKRGKHYVLVHGALGKTKSRTKAKQERLLKKSRRQTIENIVNAVELDKAAVFTVDAQPFKVRYEILLAAFTILLQKAAEGSRG
jgi:hypothetical protein